MAAASWRTIPLGDVLAQRVETADVDDETLYQQVTVRIRGRGLAPRGTVPGAKIKTKRQFRIAAGQLLVSKIDARNGAFGIVTSDLEGAIVTQDFPTFDVRPECLPEYVGLVVSQPAFWDDCLLASEGSTNRVRLNIDEFLGLEIDIPTLDEQRKIVRTVQAFDVAIGCAVSERDALARLLRATQQALIRALPGTELVRLGDVAVVGTGSTPSRKDPGHFGGAVPWAKTGDIRYRDISETQETLSESGLASCSARLLPEGSVVLAMIGQGATRGRAAVLARPMATNQNAAGIVPGPQLDARYLFHWLWMNYDELRGGAAGTSQPALNGKMVSDLLLPLPGIHEQVSVAARLDALHRVLNDAEDAIAPLLQVRAATADALVSGQRRVRKTVAA